MAIKKKSTARNKARRPPLQGTGYSDSELNAKIKDFPALLTLWQLLEHRSVLINPEQTANIIGSYDGDKDKVKIKYEFCRYRGRYELVQAVILGMYYLIRKYRLTLVVESMRIRVGDDLSHIGLHGWSISSYERRRSVSLIKMLFDINVHEFKHRSTYIFQKEFGAWLAHMPQLRVSLIPANESLYNWLRMECVILGVLRSSLTDCRASVTEWAPITLGKSTPTLNRLHRIVNPEVVRSAKEKSFTQAGVFLTSIIVTFFGCSDVRVVYPRCYLEDDLVDVACFFGRVNLGEIRPTAREARAVLKLCETDSGLHISDATKYVLRILDEICRWSEHRECLLHICKEVVKADADGEMHDGYVGRLWYMV